jgi:hypothetical protein
VVPRLQLTSVAGARCDDRLSEGKEKRGLATAPAPLFSGYGVPAAGSSQLHPLVRFSTSLVTTLGFHLGFAPFAMDRLQQFLGDRLVKNIGTDATQRFIAPRIRFGP